MTRLAALFLLLAFPSDAHAENTRGSLGAICYGSLEDFEKIYGKGFVTDALLGPNSFGFTMLTSRRGDDAIGAILTPNGKMCVFFDDVGTEPPGEDG